MVTDLDYQAAFRSLPTATALLDPNLTILDVSDGYVDAAGRDREEIIGRNILDAFPENPSDPLDSGPHDLRESLQNVLQSRERDRISVCKYDVEDPDRPGVFEERYWSIVNAPVCYDAEVKMIVHIAAEVTHLVRQGQTMNC